MKNRAIVVAFHKYTPFGDQYYEPIAEFFFSQMKKYQDEYDTIHVVDSNWNFNVKKSHEELGDFGAKITVHKVSPHLRYYDAYKEILPKIPEELVLFMDNDMVIYRAGIIRGSFLKLEPSLNNKDTYDVVSIYDTCGTYTTDKLNGKNKFTPYFFATRKELLMKYLDVEWGPNMPKHETLGKLTEVMLKDGLKPYEMEEDKSNVLLDSQYEGSTITFDTPKGVGIKKSKDLGYYHIRAGSTPAYLLATKKYGNEKTYKDYVFEQPMTEYLRQMAWYWWMCYETKNQEVLVDLAGVLQDVEIEEDEWFNYFQEFVYYHGLKTIGN